MSAHDAGLFAKDKGIKMEILKETHSMKCVAEYRKHDGIITDHRNNEHETIKIGEWDLPEGSVVKIWIPIIEPSAPVQEAVANATCLSASKEDIQNTGTALLLEQLSIKQL